VHRQVAVSRSRSQKSHRGPSFCDQCCWSPPTCTSTFERNPVLARSLVYILSLFCTTQGIWSRALGLPIERPKSMTTQNIIDKFGPVTP
jgi:hypothetical protein